MAEDEGVAEGGSPPQLTMRERWALVTPHREHMLAVARKRCASEEDAEDCVQEAMLRVARFERLDPARVEALLTSVTTRLIVDAHRRRTVEQRYRPRLLEVPEQLAPPDEAALDVDEARWLAGRVDDLPERERAVFAQRAAGFSAGEAAARLNLSYKSVESAFTRARGRLRSWAGAGALLVVEYIRRLRQRPATAWTSAAMISAGCLFLSSALPGASGQAHGAAPHAPAARAGVLTLRNVDAALADHAPAARLSHRSAPPTRPLTAGGDPALTGHQRHVVFRADVPAPGNGTSVDVTQGTYNGSFSDVLLQCANRTAEAVQRLDTYGVGCPQPQ